MKGAQIKVNLKIVDEITPTLERLQAMTLDQVLASFGSKAAFGEWIDEKLASVKVEMEADQKLMLATIKFDE